MEDTSVLIESLYDKTKEYTATTIELAKLKALDKTSDLVSSLVPRLLALLFLLIFLFIVNIALSLWLGELLGKSYYGFLVVAGFYLCVVFIIHLMYGRLKKQISNAIITRLLS